MNLEKQCWIWKNNVEWQQQMSKKNLKNDIIYKKCKSTCSNRLFTATHIPGHIQTLGYLGNGMGIGVQLYL